MQIERNDNMKKISFFSLINFLKDKFIKAQSNTASSGSAVLTDEIEFNNFDKKDVIKVSFEEAKAITKKVLELSNPVERLKLAMDNIVFYKYGEVPLMDMIFELCIQTKEHPFGTIYNKRAFQIVLRIIDGKLLSRDKDSVERPDVYAWPVQKVVNAENKKDIGLHSVEGVHTYTQVLATIKEAKERELFTNFMVNLPKDVILVHTEAEKRMVIEVTQELIDQGITYVPNSYDIEMPAEGADGVELTPIKVGDALVIEHCSFGEAFYVVQAKEYGKTYEKVA
jgi:hypothetical protein